MTEADKLCLVVIIISIYLLLTGCAAPQYSKPAQGWGKIEGTVKTEWKKTGRDMILLEDVAYHAPDKTIWVAKQGEVINGASIPKAFWSIIGGPYEGEYRWASVFHDVACDNRTRTWREVHYMFYTAMRAAGVPLKKAKIMYAAVYKYGPRWPCVNKVIPPAPTPEDLKQAETINETVAR